MPDVHRGSVSEEPLDEVTACQHQSVRWVAFEDGIRWGPCRWCGDEVVEPDPDCQYPHRKTT